MSYKILLPVEIGNKIRMPGDVLDASEFRPPVPPERELAEGEEADIGEIESLKRTGHIEEITA